MKPAKIVTFVTLADLMRGVETLLVYQSCCKNRVISKINCEFDCHMFVLTNNRQGLDIELPTI